MMLFSQTCGLPVITAGEAVSLGRVESLTIDAHAGGVACLRLSGAPARQGVLPWNAVEAVGPDAVIVHSRHWPGWRRTRPRPSRGHGATGVDGRRLRARDGGKDIAFDPRYRTRPHPVHGPRGDLPGTASWAWAPTPWW